MNLKTLCIEGLPEMPNEVQSFPPPEKSAQKGGGRGVFQNHPGQELSLRTAGESKGNADVRFRAAGLPCEAGLSRPTRSTWLL